MGKVYECNFSSYIFDFFLFFFLFFFFSKFFILRGDKISIILDSVFSYFQNFIRRIAWC